MKSIGLLYVAVVCGLARDVTLLQTEPSFNDILDGTWHGIEQPPAPAFCGGWVSLEAEIKKALPPNCFQVNQTSTGVYVILFTPPLRGLPICTANQIFPVSFDNHGNTKDNVVIMNADMSKMAYVTGEQFGRPSSRDVTFLCIA